MRLRGLLILSALWFAAATPARAYTAYISNEKGNTVTVIDTADNRVIAEIPTGKAPTSISVLPDGLQAYVTDEGSGTIEILNLPQ